MSTLDASLQNLVRINIPEYRSLAYLKCVVFDADPGEGGHVLADGLPDERLVLAPRHHPHADERGEQRRAPQPHVRREGVETQQAVQVEEHLGGWTVVITRSSQD